MIELRRGDVVLVAFPFIAQREVQQKRRGWPWWSRQIDITAAGLP